MPDTTPLSVRAVGGFGAAAASSVAADRIAAPQTAVPASSMSLIWSPLRPSRRALPYYRQIRVQGRGRIAADPDVERLRVLHPLPLRGAPVPELLGSER